MKPSPGVAYGIQCARAVGTTYERFLEVWQPGWWNMTLGTAPAPVAAQPRHSALEFDFDTLLSELHNAAERKLVSIKTDRHLSLYCYTQACVYERAWTPITRLARGLILDTAARRVAALSFPKFFNLNEIGGDSLPELSFATYEKLDGSLIIIWHDRVDEAWRCATKGSFNSVQARAAQAWLDRKLACAGSSRLYPGVTYLAEWIAPDNRIVVPYIEPELVLLGAYSEDGIELTCEHLSILLSDWRFPTRYDCDSLVDLVATAQALPKTQEGFVLRFEDGTRIKLKGDEYKRIHAAISGCTPLSVWSVMQTPTDAAGALATFAHGLPEEFRDEFETIKLLLERDLRTLIVAIASEAQLWATCSDRELGIALPSVPEPARHFIFAWRKTKGNLLGHPKSRAALFRAIRPHGNKLLGYEPSSALIRVQEDTP